MRYEGLRSNRRAEAVSPDVGFLSGLTGRPIVRAVALLLTLELSGCYTSGAWEPLAPGVAPLPDRILIRAPASDTFPRGREVDLLHPWMDGDSVLMGTLNRRGHELRDLDGRLAILRLPAGELQVAIPRVFSPGRTAALVYLGACSVFAFYISLKSSMESSGRGGGTIMW